MKPGKTKRPSANARRSRVPTIRVPVWDWEGDEFPRYCVFWTPRFATLAEARAFAKELREKGHDPTTKIFKS